MSPTSSARRWRILRPFLLSLVAAGLVAGAVFAWIPPPQGTPVLVTTQVLAPGDTLERDDVRVVRVPDDAVPTDALEVESTLPATWPVEGVEAGTILTDSNTGDTTVGVLAPGERQVTIAMDAAQASLVHTGDVVDVWSTPSMCDQGTCTASLLASAVRIVSSVVTGDPSWGSATTPDAQVTLILRVEDIDRVLGHAGTNSLTVVLRPSGSASDSSGEIP